MLTGVEEYGHHFLGRKSHIFPRLWATKVWPSFGTINLCALKSREEKVSKKQHEKFGERKTEWVVLLFDQSLLRSAH